MLIILHLTPITNSMQASARIALFLQSLTGAPIITSEEEVRALAADSRKSTRYTILLVNSPSAFSKALDPIGNLVFPKTDRVIWIQNDYTLIPAPHQSYSRPSSAVTPFRSNFFKIPRVDLWSTCKDTIVSLQKRSKTGRRAYDHYINWNALTYSPVSSLREDRSPQIAYYGALRKERLSSFQKFLNHESVTISVSSTRAADDWREVAPEARLKKPVKTAKSPKVAFTSKNTVGSLALLDFVDRHQHSVYLADHKSQSGAHSLANRFYEVMSTPNTILWLDAAGESAYKSESLEDYSEFLVKSLSTWPKICSLKPSTLEQMADHQRSLWVNPNPYLSLKKLAASLVTTLME